MHWKKNRLTKKGYEKLVKELKDLKEVKYPKVLERLAEAKAMWDLSENFEYKSSLEDREIISARIAEVESLVDDVEIIKETKSTSGKAKKVDYGAVVTFKLEDKKKYTVTIVWTGEVDLDDGLKMSLKSPIWIAIKGKKVGDKVKMKLLQGRQEVEIVEIK